MNIKTKRSYDFARDTLVAFGSHWFSVVMLTYIGLYALQTSFIFPFERAYFGELTSYASLMFLPHAVRVIAAWLIGPKAILALFPASLISMTFYGDISDKELDFYFYCLLSSASGVIAFEFLKLMKMNIYPSGDKMSSWRNVLFSGCIASFINSLISINFTVAKLQETEIVEVIFRYIIGDFFGLLVSMFVLMIVFRYSKYSEK